LWVTADGAEPSLKSHGLEPVRGECDDWAIKNAMDTVGFQFLGLVVITAIPLVAEEVVLEAVDVHYMYPSSWLELVKLVRCPRQGVE